MHNSLRVPPRFGARFLLRATLAAAPACATLLAAPVVHAAAAGAQSPQAQLKSTQDRLDALLKKQKESEGDKKQIKALVDELIDYRDLAERALAQHWKGLTPAQRDEFVKTLNDLIERNYVKQLRTNLDYAVTYSGEEVKGEEATVNTVVKVRTRGKSTDTAIDYKMKQVSGRWMVYDVITDEVSMVKNYKSQFNKIIANEGFDGLLKKMRKKIDEGESTASK